MNARFDSLDPTRGGRSFEFRGLRETVVARTPEEVIPALRRVEQEVARGRHAAGFVAYEAGHGLDPHLAVHPIPSRLPLVCFGIFDEREDVAGGSHRTNASEEGYRLGPLEPSISRGRYEERVREILELITAGDTYQVNFTFRLRGRFEGDPLALYRALCDAQRSAYCAYIEVGEHVLISASPELFYHRRDDDVEMRPMKGTRPRGRWTAEDDALAAELAASPKERAENLMIVDLLRNDLGRVAQYGSIEVPALFEVERYPTVHQLTSTVRGVLRPEADLAELFVATFPSGSVTGAPKVRTSQIIRDLEDSSRGPYTGAIGFVSPRDSVFSVAIRTAVLDRAEGAIEVGVGSGITADSCPEAEYRECMEKGMFLRRSVPPFELLESLRLEAPEGYPLLAAHLSRLTASARYFGFPFPEAEIRNRLDRVRREVPVGTYKVRLTLSREGAVVVGAEAIPSALPAARLRLARVPVDESDPILYHKTTHRRLYDDALAAAPDCDDVVLLNRRGELTETTRANLVLDLGGTLVTPPVECGLLPGVMRETLLHEGRIQTRVLTPADLANPSRIYLVNAVRGWREGVLADSFSDR